jgi:hypothetical protein
VRWGLPPNGGSEILEGLLEIRESDGSTFAEESTHCALREDSAAFDGRECVVPLAALRLDSPATNSYQLAQGQAFALRIRFRNEVGWGPVSSLYTAPGLVMETVPHDPLLAPHRLDSSTLGTQIGVGVTALAGLETGGSPILSYEVEIDHDGGGTGPWTEVAGGTTDSLDLEHVVSALTPGELYFFRYRARNQHGWSEGYSPVQSILLATVPSAPPAARTTNSGADVLVDWDAPASDGSAPLLAYRVRLRGADGLLHVESSHCDGGGSEEAAILAARSCTIPMTVL